MQIVIVLKKACRENLLKPLWILVEMKSREKGNMDKNPSAKQRIAEDKRSLCMENRIFPKE
jgi:hypothetical protein